MQIRHLLIYVSLASRGFACELRGAPGLKVHDIFGAKTAGLIIKQLGSYEGPVYPLQKGV